MTSQPGLGAPAPPFSLPRDGGGTVSLDDYRGKTLVLFFYPKADTPGCTREVQAFAALRGAFERAGASVLGISADSVKRQDAFKRKYDLDLVLGSDETQEMLNQYGVWTEKAMYGRRFMGIERTTFLIDREGRIARVWLKVKIDGHAEEVLKAARTL